MANGDSGAIRVRVRFSRTNLIQCKQNLERLSEDPTKFAEAFQAQLWTVT